MGYEKLLTPGAITKILNDEKPESPVLQVIGFKPIGQEQMRSLNNKDELTYRLMIGDGHRAHQYCIVSNQDLVRDIRSGKIEKWSVVKLTNYHSVDQGDSPENRRKLIYALNWDMVVKGSEVNQKLVRDNVASAADAEVGNGNGQSIFHQPAPTPPQPTSYAAPTQPKPYEYGGSVNRGVIESPRRVHPSYEQHTIGIGELTPYIGKWNVKGRVTSKSALREYNNAKGPGKLFSFTITDNSGEVKVTAFNQDCERFFPMVEANKVYILSRGTVKNADKRYTSADFEITLNSDSLMEEVRDASQTSDVPLAKFNFLSIAALTSVQPNQPVDLIGVIEEVSDMSTVMSKTKNKELKKRNITIVDNSRHTISVTIWGDPADTFNGAKGDVFATKAARISTYGGRSASAGDCIFINPDVPEARKVRNWHSSLLDSNFTALTSSQEGGSSNEQYKYLSDMKNMALVRNAASTGVSSTYAKCKAYILSIGKNPVYKCCPVDGCGKKLVDMQNGEMKCDKCAQTYSNYRYRFKVDVEICDLTDSCWVTLWDEKAENLLKVKPEELEKMMKLENKDQYEKVITSCNFQMYNFTLRSRIETYNQEEKVKVHVVNMGPLEPVSYAKELQSQIRALAARGVPTN